MKGIASRSCFSVRPYHDGRDLRVPDFRHAKGFGRNSHRALLSGKEVHSDLELGKLLRTESWFLRVTQICVEEAQSDDVCDLDHTRSVDAAVDLQPFHPGR